LQQFGKAFLPMRVQLLGIDLNAQDIGGRIGDAGGVFSAFPANLQPGET
jgi:hypothetical protein